MRRKLCLGCSLAGAWLYHLLLAEISFSFWIYNSFMSQKKHRLCDRNYKLASCLRHHASLLSFPLHADAYPWQS